MVCECTCKREKKYIAFRDFWVEGGILIKKGQIFKAPVPMSWMSSLKEFNPYQNTAELAAKTIVENETRDDKLTQENAVVGVDDEVITKKPKRKKKKVDTECVFELPEKSEILLSELQE